MPERKLDWTIAEFDEGGSGIFPWSDYAEWIADANWCAARFGLTFDPEHASIRQYFETQASPACLINLYIANVGEAARTWNVAKEGDLPEGWERTVMLARLRKGTLV